MLTFWLKKSRKKGEEHTLPFMTIHGSLAITKNLNSASFVENVVNKNSKYKYLLLLVNRTTELHWMQSISAVYCIDFISLNIKKLNRRLNIYHSNKFFRPPNKMKNGVSFHMLIIIGYLSNNNYLLIIIKKTRRGTCNVHVKQAQV